MLKALLLVTLPPLLMNDPGPNTPSPPPASIVTAPLFVVVVAPSWKVLVAATSILPADAFKMFTRR